MRNRHHHHHLLATYAKSYYLRRERAGYGVTVTVNVQLQT